MVHERQEAFVELQCRVVVALEPDAKGMHLVLVEEAMGERAQKRAGILASRELLGDLAKRRGAHAGDGPSIHGGDEPRMKLPVAQVDVFRQAAAHEFCGRVLAEARQLGT